MTHWRGLFAHLLYIQASVTTCGAAGLSSADMQWSIHVLSLSLRFPSSITQARAEAIFIIITSLHAETAVMKTKHTPMLIH